MGTGHVHIYIYIHIYIHAHGVCSVGTRETSTVINILLNSIPTRQSHPCTLMYIEHGQGVSEACSPS